MDAEVLRAGVRIEHCRGFAARRVLFPSSGRLARGRWLACGSFWRTQRYVVGIVGGVDQPIPFVLSQTEFIVHTIRGPAQFHIGLSAAIFTVLLFALGVAFACGMASTFKYVGDDFPDNMGIVTGIVGLAGGLGGFLLPILFGAILDWLGINSSCFMFLYGVVWVSLILNYTTEVRRLPVMGEQASTSAKSFPSIPAGISTKTGETDLSV
jgi:MFS family permease